MFRGCVLCCVCNVRECRNFVLIVRCHVVSLSNVLSYFVIKCVKVRSNKRNALAVACIR